MTHQPTGTSAAASRPVGEPGAPQARSGSHEEQSGWPDRPGDTALSIKLPPADHLVSTGIRAHVTVLYPFLPVERLHRADRGAGAAYASVHHELLALFAAHRAFELRFAAFRRAPGVLFLDPEPQGPVRALTAALTTRWPEAVPYRGVFGPDGLDPHLTAGHHEDPEGYGAAFDALEAELAPSLPLAVRVTEVQLIVRDGTGWQDHCAYRLGPDAPAIRS